MTLYEWLILGAIAALCVYACYVVADEKKKGHGTPGPLCGGNPACGRDEEHQIML